MASQVEYRLNSCGTQSQIRGPTRASRGRRILYHWATREALRTAVSTVARVVKRLPANAGDLGSIPGSGRSPGEENGNPLQSSCLENPMDRGAWWATVHGLAKSQTRLSNFIFTFNLMVTYYNSNWKLKCYFNSVHLVLILIIYGCKAVYGIFFFFKLCFFFF